ncbi:MAG TPA: YciI family protein [Candidatus Acidoferrales bacterium]|nr:YciI family protein [Candidatus Acidoferrales bacterium]
MKYICLAYEEEHKLNTLTKSEWDSLRTQTMNYVEDLRRRGKFISAEPLQSVRNATTVRVRNRKLSITDGPFSETKETLGGFFLIEASDLNEAIQIASEWPSARFGSIEIRPVENGLREDGRYETVR